MPSWTLKLRRESFGERQHESTVNDWWESLYNRGILEHAPGQDLAENGVPIVLICNVKKFSENTWMEV